MSEPAKDEAELIDRVGESMTWYVYCSKANARNAIAAIRAAGWAVVPVEPTEEMLDAAERAFPVESCDFYSMCRKWAAMLAAAPGVKP